MTAYYNEIDPFAAEWLRELIKAGHIAPGIVDTRSIEDVEPADLRGFSQCHFFAGIGVWSYALRQAGWPDSRRVWTGSCPCQPFSAAGKRTGTADERHLWPAWFHLIESCRPEVVFGEQVEAAIKHGWLDLVQADLEGSGYACTAVCLPAAGVGAPHIRSRLYFVADSDEVRRQHGSPHGSLHGSGDVARGRGQQPTEECAAVLSVADTERNGRRSDLAGREAQGRDADGRDCQARQLADTELSNRRPQHEVNRDPHWRSGLGWSSATGELGHAGDSRLSQRSRAENGRGTIRHEGQAIAAPGLTNGFWRDAEWLWCRDGKYRPVEPGTFPLAHGATQRVGRLRGYGNAIVAPVAQAFIEAYLNATS